MNDERGFNWGKFFANAALVLLCVIWTIPTLGLLISSFRAPNDINNSGWWTVFQGGSTQSFDLGIEVLPEPEDDMGRDQIVAGETLQVSSADTRVFEGVVDGYPSPQVQEVSVEEVEGVITFEEAGASVEIPDAGTATIDDAGVIDFAAADGFTSQATFDFDPEDDELEFPLEVEFALQSLKTATGTLVVEAEEDEEDASTPGWEVIVPQVGTLFINEDGTHTFEARSASFVGSFEPVIPDDLTEPFEVEYTLQTNLGTPPESEIQEIQFVASGEPGETLSIPAVGDITLNADGSYEFTSLESFNGEVQIDYRINNPTFTLSNYQTVLGTGGGDGGQMGTAFINSLTVTIPATIIPIAIAAFSAYAFAWMDFPGRRLLFVIVVGLMVVPLQLAFIPLLQLYTWTGLNGTYLGLWLAHTGFGMPLAVFLLRNYMAGLPREIIESAKIDGASHFTIFVRLIIPLSVPAVASFAIFQFLWVWNDLLVALVFLGDTPVVTSRLSELVGSRGQDWHVLTAGAFVTMAVPLLVFFSLQRYFVRGLLAGSVKGG